MVDENQFFRQATLRIFSSLTAETAMKHLMAYLREYMPVSGMSFGVYDPDMNVGRYLAAIWPPHMTPPPDTVAIPRAFWSWMREMWAEEAGIQIFNDMEKAEEPVFQLLSPTYPKDTSFLFLDLELEKKRLGMVIFLARGKNRFEPAHARLISLLHEPFVMALSNILHHQEMLRLKDILADHNRFLHNQMMEMTGGAIIGADFGLRSVMEMVFKVAPLDSPVLLLGETGVGKELLANAIHSASTRKNNPLIKVNCGAIPENLIDSELFGHEKGAFTGAISVKKGRFERADTGTIFLDEVGELPPAAQVRLLRVLQQHEIERVGGTTVIPVDVRVISATHQNLEQMTKDGGFREDLWFRLNVFPIMIPPLRQRLDDIPALVFHFLEKKSRELKIWEIPKVPGEEMERLRAYLWPGNVRELENLVERALIQSRVGGGQGRLSFFGPSELRHGPTRGASPRPMAVHPLDRVVADHIEAALAKTNGRVEGEKGAAHLLGLHPSTLRGKMKKLGIVHGRRFPGR